MYHLVKYLQVFLLLPACALVACNNGNDLSQETKHLLRYGPLANKWKAMEVIPPDAQLSADLPGNVEYVDPIIVDSVWLDISKEHVTVASNLQFTSSTGKSYRVFAHLMKGNKIVYNLDHDLSVEDGKGHDDKNNYRVIKHEAYLAKCFSRSDVDSLEYGLLNLATNQRIWIKRADAPTIDRMTAIRWPIR